MNKISKVAIFQYIVYNYLHSERFIGCIMFNFYNKKNRRAFTLIIVIILILAMIIPMLSYSFG